MRPTLSNVLWVLCVALIITFAIAYQCRMNQELPRYPPEEFGTKPGELSYLEAQWLIT